MADRWVIKLGGSLCGHPLLQDWLSAICEHGKGRIVVVPGGGPFADAVRVAQKKCGFDDVAAHRMALLAMEQNAVMLAAMHTKFSLAKNKYEIDAQLKTERIPIWLAADMSLAETDLPATWDLTSDSLAAWLAGQISARNVLLVKSCKPSNDAWQPAQWAQQGIVDRLFPRYVSEGNLSAHIAMPEDSPNLAKLLLNGITNE